MPWDSMDYMFGLPSTKHANDYVIYQFSKMVVLTPCKKRITVEAIVKLFFERGMKMLCPREVDISSKHIRAHKPFGFSSSRVMVLDI